MDLVVAGCEVDDEARAVLTALKPLGESLGESERQQSGRARIEPLGRKAEVSGDHSAFSARGELSSQRQEQVLGSLLRDV